MTIIFDRDDDKARMAFENFCFKHPLTHRFKTSANPMDRIGNKLYEMISTLESSHPYLYRGDFTDHLKSALNQYIKMETSLLDERVLSLLRLQKAMTVDALQLGEPDLCAIFEDNAHITYGEPLSPDHTEFLYSADELKAHLLGTVRENQDISNFPYPGDIKQYYFNIPRAMYDALLCMCVDKLKPIDTSTPSYTYW